MKKRIAIFFITIGIIMSLILNVKAAPAKGEWVLVDVRDQGTEINSGDFNHRCNRGEFSIHWDIEWREPTGGYEVTEKTIDGVPTTAVNIGGEDRRTQGHVSVVYTGFPERIASGETATLSGSFSREIHGNDTGYLLSAGAYKSLGYSYIYTFVEFQGSKEAEFKLPYLSSEGSYDNIEDIPLTFPQGQEGDIVVIYVGVPGKIFDLMSTSFIDDMSSTFRYEYHENTPPSPGSVRQIEDRSPRDYSGEEMTDIKTAAILGVAATVAAIAAAGASAAGSSAAASTATQEAIEESARQKIGDYRMVVYKSFGDTIHYGKTDEYVVARIEYKDEQTGTWFFDAERSDAISITISQVEGLELYPLPLNPAAPGKGHTIMLTNKEPVETQATLSFKFTAPDGGFFQRNMVFKLMGEPCIRLDSNKVWFLEGDYEPFDLKCQLLGYDPAKYDIYLDGMDAFVILEMSKNIQGEDAIKVTPVQGVYDDWDKRAFIYSYPCSIAYEDKQTMDRIAKVEFTVNFCYEGIGLAMSHPKKQTRIDRLLEPFELWAFNDAESYRRTEEMLCLALIVARWNDKERFLEYDTAAAETLELDYSLDLSSNEFKTGSAKTEAMRALKDAALKTSCRGDTPFGFKSIDYRADMKPAFFGTITTQSTESGLAPFPILLTISLPNDKYPELVLKGNFNPMCEWEEVVRWFFGVPAGTLAAAQMRIGNPDLYVEALEFIENRVYSFRNVPFAPSNNQNHYEDGIIASTTHKRLRSVVLRNSDIPTGIGDYKKAQTLVHELTHALEHKNMGDMWTLFSASAGHERHTYFLQYASDAIYELALAERDINAENNVKKAIASMHRSYFNSNNTPEPRNLEWFGASIPTQHNLFKAYLNNWLQVGTCTGAGKVGEIISRKYFPGALKNKDSNYPANFEIQSGRLKGTCFIFSWVDGMLVKFSVWHKDYKFEIKNPLRWNGGFTLKTRFEVIDKLASGGMSTGSAQRDRDTFTVTFTASETFNAENPEYMNITGFNAVWRLEGGNDNHSVVAPDVHGGRMTTALISNNGLKRKHED